MSGITVRLPTGETLGAATLLDGAPAWNEAASVAAQLIPAALALQWATGLAGPLRALDTLIQNGGGAPKARADFHEALAAIMPLMLAGLPGTGTAAFAGDSLGLVAALTRAMRPRLQKQIGKAGPSALAAFNDSLDAFALTGRLLEACAPLIAGLGITAPAPPALGPVRTKADMQARIAALLAYGDAVEALRETLP